MPGINTQSLGNVSNSYMDQALEASEQSKLKKSTQDFEALFIEIMLKSMRKTVQDSGLMSGGNGEQIFRSMLDSEYAKLMASDHMTGLSKQLESQFLSLDASSKKLNIKSAGLHYNK